ncbi:MAG: IS66 family transposase zinc-finger binding domain-containing protein [Pirellulaceae bacterium]
MVRRHRPGLGQAAAALSTAAQAAIIISVGNQTIHSLHASYRYDSQERLCPHDGQPMQPIRYEISQQLDYEPAKLKVIVHKRAVYACPAKHDEATLLTTPKPPQPIDKGLPGPGLLAAMVLGKFGDHLPGYRMEDILFRHGVEIRRSTIYDWLAAAADLAKLVDFMRHEVLLQIESDSRTTSLCGVDRQAASRHDY